MGLIRALTEHRRRPRLQGAAAHVPTCCRDGATSYGLKSAPFPCPPRADDKKAKKQKKAAGAEAAPAAPPPPAEALVVELYEDEGGTR
jgi:hypothetical protein